MNKAVIMAGGFGTRLRPLTMNIPKPMVPIMNVPMMEHIVNLLSRHGIKDIVSVLYFHPDAITSHFEDGSGFGCNMKYVMAQADYGTAGAVRNAAEHLGERFIIISGDVLTDFDLSKALEFHVERGSKATILLTRVTKPLQYGIVMTDQDGKINRFLEKPSWGEVFSDTINTGIYILEPEVLDLIPFQEEFDFSKDLFPLMLRQNMPLYGYICDGYWRDIGNLNEYQQGQFDAIRSAVRLDIKGEKRDNTFIGKNVKIAPSAQLKGMVVVGDNSVVGENTVIADSVLGEGCQVGAGVHISASTIWNNVRVGDFASISDDVICNGCSIGEQATISENVFISDECTIGPGASLMQNIKLWPLKNVEAGSVLSRSLVQEEKWVRELFTDARISGTSNIEINPDFGAKLGEAIGMAFGPNSTVLASRGPDKVARIVKRVITSGLSSVGVNVNDLQSISIPQTRQEIRTGKYSGGIHVRRSPRHPDKTDIIIFNKEGRDISISMTKSIERYFFGEDIVRVHHDKVGSITYPERTNEIYLKRFIDTLDINAIRNKKFKLLMDYSFGLASTIFPQILGTMHTNTISLHDYVDPSRFMPDPYSDQTENVEAVKIMRSLGYEMGFVMEPGAEKISIIDERGVCLSPQRVLSLVTKLFLETNRHREPYKIAVSVVATNEIEDIAADYGVEVVRIKNSHSAMMEATRDPQVLFVGGVWGGFIFSDFLFASDGMYSVGKILEMIAKSGKGISELDQTLGRRYQYQIDVACPWEAKGTVMRRAMEYSENMKRQLVEGVKIFSGDESVLLLPQKESAGFSVISESKHYDSAITNAKKYSSLLSHWREGGE